MAPSCRPFIRPFPRNPTSHGDSVRYFSLLLLPLFRAPIRLLGPMRLYESVVSIGPYPPTRRWQCESLPHRSCRRWRCSPSPPLRVELNFPRTVFFFYLFFPPPPLVSPVETNDRGNLIRDEFSAESNQFVVFSKRSASLGLALGPSPSYFNQCKQQLAKTSS